MIIAKIRTEVEGKRKSRASGALSREMVLERVNMFFIMIYLQKKVYIFFTPYAFCGCILPSFAGSSAGILILPSEVLSKSFPRVLTATSHPKKIKMIITPTNGALIATVPKKMISDWCIKEAPDLPSLEPTPSIADFPFRLHSLLRGKKAISLVTSKKVNFEALEKQFCIDPRKAVRTSGVVPKAAAIFMAIVVDLPR